MEYRKCKPITLEQFLKVFNFRQCRTDDAGNDELDTKIIRIHPRQGEQLWEWFEFGAYDYSEAGALSVARNVLAYEILNMYIEYVNINDSGTVELHICDLESLDCGEFDSPKKELCYEK